MLTDADTRALLNETRAFVLSRDYLYDDEDKEKARALGRRISAVLRAPLAPALPSAGTVADCIMSAAKLHTHDHELSLKITREAVAAIAGTVDAEPTALAKRRK